MRRLLMVACLAVWGAVPAGGQSKAADALVNRPLSTNTLGGQKVTVLPLAAVAQGEGTGLEGVWADRRTALRRADTLVADVLLMAAPEVAWVTPDETRRMARRSAALVGDPDQLGHAILRAPGLKSVPDPLRARLRTLAAIAGGRYVLAPSFLALVADSTAGLRAELAIVVVDPRSGEVLWRSVATGRGRDPDGAVRGALTTLFPNAALP